MSPGPGYNILVRAVALALLTLPCAGGAQVAGQRPRTSSMDSSLALRRRLAEAVANQDEDEALALTQRLASLPRSTADEALLAGKLLQSRSRLKEAIRWYRIARDRAGRGNPEVVSEAALREASALSESGDPAAAISELRAAVSARQLARDDATVLVVLGQAQLSAGRRADAACAAQTAIEVDPLEAPAWQLWAEVSTTAQAPVPPLMGADTAWLCPSSPQALRRVLNIGPASAWKLSALEGNLRSYRAFADTLARRRYRRRADAYRRAAWHVPSFYARRLIRSGTSMDAADSALALFGLAEAAIPSDSLPIHQRVTNLQDMAAGYRRTGRFDQALEAMEQVLVACAPGAARWSPCMLDSLESPPMRSNYADLESARAQKWDTMLEVNLGVLGRILTDAFISVSWDRRTGQIRSANPDNFMGNMVARTGGKPTESPSRARLPAEFPYGMTSLEEDRVTFLTELRMNRAGVATRTSRAYRMRNPEFLTKLLLAEMLSTLEFKMIGDLSWLEAGKVHGVPVATLDSIATEGSGAVETTRVALAATMRAARLLRRVEVWYAVTSNVGARGGATRR